MIYIILNDFTYMCIDFLSVNEILNDCNPFVVMYSGT